MFIFFSVSKIGIFRENFEILRDNNEIYWHFLEKFRMSFRPFFRIFGSKALSALEAKVKLSRQNQKTIVIKNFCFVCCIRIKSFKAVRQIPSAPDLFIRPASIVFGTEFHLQSTGFILSRFKILESPNFATKDIFFPFYETDFNSITRWS